MGKLYESDLKGSYQKHNIKTVVATISELKKKGYKIIMWDVLSFDWDNTISNDECYTNVISKAKGNYIALLEGDDYWSNENKLQIQYDFMQNHPNLSTVFHEVKMIDRNGLLISTLPKSNFKMQISLFLNIRLQ